MRAYGTQPRFHVPAQLCDPSDRPLCVHVLLSAGRRSSHQGGNEQQDPPWPKSAISFLHVDTFARPVVSSLPTLFVPLSPISKQGPDPPPTSRPLLVGCFFASFDTGRLDSSRHPACLPASHTLLLLLRRPSDQGSNPLTAHYLGHGPAVIVASLIRATYSTRKRFIPTSARYYYAHLHFFRLTSTHFASMICIGFLD